MASEAKSLSLSFDADFVQRIDVVYDLLANLRGYQAWLPRSIAFHGTSEISPGPTVVGTRYIESSPWGTRRGIVTEATKPTRLAFHQPMTLRPEWLGQIDIRLGHDLSSDGTKTHLHRTVDLAIIGPVRLISGAIARSFETENRRMLAKLKAYAESTTFPAQNT